jgi:calcineurin-like phosphoesterase family protein
MKIQVQCRRSGEPRTFLLGARWLHVISVLDRVAESSLQRFRLLVADGREFVLRHDPRSGDWQLARVQARRQRFPDA